MVAPFGGGVHPQGGVPFLMESLTWLSQGIPLKGVIEWIQPSGDPPLRVWLKRGEVPPPIGEGPWKTLGGTPLVEDPWGTPKGLS